MVQAALTNVAQTATAVTDLMGTVSLDVLLGGEEDTAKMVQKGLSKCICLKSKIK